MLRALALFTNSKQGTRRPTMYTDKEKKHVTDPSLPSVAYCRRQRPLRTPSETPFESIDGRCWWWVERELRGRRSHGPVLLQRSFGWTAAGHEGACRIGAAAHRATQKISYVLYIRVSSSIENKGLETTKTLVQQFTFYFHAGVRCFSFFPRDVQLTRTFCCFVFGSRVAPRQ